MVLSIRLRKWKWHRYWLFFPAQGDPRQPRGYRWDTGEGGRKWHDQSVSLLRPLLLLQWAVCESSNSHNMNFWCSRLDMTQELLDCLDAGLKMAETSESIGVHMKNTSEVMPHWKQSVCSFKKNEALGGWNVYKRPLSDHGLIVKKADMLWSCRPSSGQMY